MYLHTECLLLLIPQHNGFFIWMREDILQTKTYPLEHLLQFIRGPELGHLPTLSIAGPSFIPVEKTNFNKPFGYGDSLTRNMQSVIPAIGAVVRLAHGYADGHIRVGFPAYINVQKNDLQMLLGNVRSILRKPLIIYLIYEPVALWVVRPAMDIKWA